MSPVGHPGRPPDDGLEADHYTGVGRGANAREQLVQVVMDDGKLATVPYAEAAPGAGRPTHKQLPPQGRAAQQPPPPQREPGAERVPVNAEYVADLISQGHILLGMLGQPDYRCPVALWPVRQLKEGHGVLITTELGRQLLVCSEDDYERGMALLIEVLRKAEPGPILFAGWDHDFDSDANVQAMRTALEGED